jgi:hypothetical protein
VIPSLQAQRGQASVELLGTLPALGLAALCVWQLVLAGHTAWMCAHAARSAARAEAVERDPKAAARSALPRSLERGMRVESDSERRVRVEVRVPLLVPGWGSPVPIAATAGLERGP